jgi:hypothetical protein
MYSPLLFPDSPLSSREIPFPALRTPSPFIERRVPMTLRSPISPENPFLMSPPAPNMTSMFGNGASTMSTTATSNTAMPSVPQVTKKVVIRSLELVPRWISDGVAKFMRTDMEGKGPGNSAEWGMCINAWLDFEKMMDYTGGKGQVRPLSDMFK